MGRSITCSPNYTRWCGGLHHGDSLSKHAQVPTLRTTSASWYEHIPRSSGLAKTILILQGIVKGTKRRGRRRKRRRKTSSQTTSESGQDRTFESHKGLWTTDRGGGSGLLDPLRWCPYCCACASPQSCKKDQCACASPEWCQVDQMCLWLHSDRVR